MQACKYVTDADVNRLFGYKGKGKCSPLRTALKNKRRHPAVLKEATNPDCPKELYSLTAYGRSLTTYGDTPNVGMATDNLMNHTLAIAKITSLLMSIEQQTGDESIITKMWRDIQDGTCWIVGETLMQSSWRKTANGTETYLSPELVNDYLDVTNLTDEYTSKAEAWKYVIPAMKLWNA